MYLNFPQRLKLHMGILKREAPNISTQVLPQTINTIPLSLQYQVQLRQTL